MPNFRQANIAISTLGDNTVITGVAGDQIRVYRLILLNGVATAQTVTVKDGASTTLATLTLPSSVGGGPILADAGDTGAPWFVCSQGNNFVLNLSAATAVNGYVEYLVN